jgi:hypothetical protein
MLLIAVSHGSNPFTTSTTISMDEAAQRGLDPSDPMQMRELICKEQNLLPEWVDEVLVVYPHNKGWEPEVQHHYRDDCWNED